MNVDMFMPSTQATDALTPHVLLLKNACIAMKFWREEIRPFLKNPSLT